MKNITLDFLINHKRLFRRDMSFAMSYMVYRYKTKIEFVFEGEGIGVRCYLHQSDDDSNKFNHNILIGLVKTEDELNSMLNKITGQDE